MRLMPASSIKPMVFVLVTMISTAVATGCARRWEVRGERECFVERGQDPSAVRRNCGLPSALAWRPKVTDIWNLKMCSTPVYAYGSLGVYFDCAGRVNAVGPLSNTPNANVVRDPAFLLDLARSSSHAVVACRELGRLGAAGRGAIPELMRLADTAEDPEVQRAAREALVQLDEAIQP